MTAKIDSDWLDLAQEISTAARRLRSHAANLEQQARTAFRKAGVRNDTEDTARKKTNRILWNERPTSPAGGGGDIDEIVLHDVTVHVEQMDDRCWWIGIYRDDSDDRFAGNFHCDSRGRMGFSMQEDDLPWDRDEEHK